MKQIYLGIATIAVFTFLLAVFVFGLTFYQDYSTRQYVNQYYDDLIKGNYDNAFEHLYPWSGNPDKPPWVSSRAAKGIFLKNVSSLGARGYRIVRVDDIVVMEKGSLLGAKVKLTVSLKGQLKQVEENLAFYNAKIVVTDSQDPYAHYRDGKLAN